jgi:ribosome-binding factor A
VTGVELTPDLAHARVFVTFLANSAEPGEGLRALARCVPFLRRELGKRVRLRHIPTLTFQFDTSIEHGIRVTKLIDEATQAGNARVAE